MYWLEKTGHIHFKSIYESSDSCNTCDGGKCDSCKDRWVDDQGNIYGSEEQAKRAVEEFKNFTTVDLAYGFSIIDGHLHVLTWNSGNVFVPCNKESTLYHEAYTNALKMASRFNECTCIDKAEPDCSNSCDVLKACNDEGCFIAMKNGTITEKLSRRD